MDINLIGGKAYFYPDSFNNSLIMDLDLYGCPKSHCAKVRAYCSACDHLIRKISSGMFQKSSSFEEFNGFSEIDVHFLSERSFFTFFAPLTCLDHIPFELLLLIGSTRYEISEKIRALLLACPLFEISTVKVYVHDVGLRTASTISQACDPT